jgi:ComF family protein
VSLRARTQRLLAAAGRATLDTLLPPLCPGCGEEIPSTRWICADCRRAFRPVPSGWICFACRSETRPGGDREAGYACRLPEHDRLRGRAAYWMEPPLDALVHALKYQGRTDLGRPLGRLLARRVALHEIGACVTAVPLHRTRLRARGYNQAGLLAAAAAPRWASPPVPDVLRRSRATRAQARLPESRRAANVARAFACREGAWVEGRSWILVDDVVTTGSTLLAAARALEEAGAARVIPVGLALA